MVLISFVAISIVQSVEVVRVCNMDVDRLAKVIRGGEGFLKGVTLTLDPAQNTIILQGEKADIESAKEVISMLDVKPRRVRVRVYMSSPRTSRVWSTDTVVYNNEAVTMVDRSGAISLSLVPRVNVNNTIQITIKFTEGKASVGTGSSMVSGEPRFYLGSQPWTPAETRGFQKALGLTPSSKVEYLTDMNLTVQTKLAFVVDLLPEKEEE